jgi:hypothetical protein
MSDEIPRQAADELRKRKANKKRKAAVAKLKATTKKLSPQDIDKLRADKIVKEQAAKVPEYKLEPSRDGDENSKRYHVKEVIKGDFQPTVLAEIARIDAPVGSKRPFNPADYPYWYISNYSSTAVAKMEFPPARFPNKEQALQFVVMVRQAYLAEIKRVPLTENARRYIEMRARTLRERTAALISQLYDVRNEKWELLILAREAGVEEATHYIDDSDLGAAINALLEYKYGEHPFFSESCLYELIGKDAARSILGMMERLFAIVKPEKAIEI